jgi:hypothetical protein
MMRDAIEEGVARGDANVRKLFLGLCPVAVPSQ